MWSKKFNLKFMNYNKLKKNNAESITIIIKKQNDKLQKLINGTNKFFNGWAENCPQDKILVSFRGSVPFYIKKEYYLFQRVEIAQFERKFKTPKLTKIKTNSKDLLIELLNEIGIKRLYDEDGNNGLFTKNKEDKYGIEDYAYCYLNPFIPDGYWENHILENKYLEL